MATQVTTLNPGFGTTTLNWDTNPTSDSHTLQFGPGLSAADAIVTLTDHDSPGYGYGGPSTVVVISVTISFKNSPDVVVIPRSSAILDSLFPLDHIEFSDGTVWSAAQLIQTLQQPDHAQFYLQGSSAADALTADDRGFGMEGYGGDDTLTSGSGDDTLDGGTGHNTYVFNAGWGHDEVRINSTAVDTVQFTAGVSAADVTKKRVGWDLVLTDKNDGSTVTIPAYFELNTVGPSSLPQIQFADGTHWAYADIYHELGMPSTPYDDLIIGLASPELINGGGGSDTIFGGGGGDTLLGGDGDDSISGAWGDTIEGGAGRDTLNATGDVAVFRPHFGNDVITVYPALVMQGSDYVSVPGKATLQFTDGIQSTDVTLTENTTTNTLTVYDKVRGDSATVTGYRTQGVGVADLTLTFADGVQWSGNVLQQHIVTTTLATGVVQQGSSSVDVLTASGNNDTLIGGGGSDTLVVGYNTRIDLTGTSAQDVDTLVLGDGVRPQDIRFGTYASTMSIDTGNSQGVITVSQVAGAGPVAGHIALKFADGTTWSADEVARRVLAGSGLSEGLNADDGKAEVFQFNAGNGNDTIFGFDTVNSGQAGDTTDLINLDTNDVSFTQVNDSYVSGGDHYGNVYTIHIYSTLITRRDSGETLKLYGIPLSGSVPIVRLPNGFVLTGDELGAYRPGVGTLGDDSLVGTDQNDVLQGYAGKDTLQGLAGNDLLQGGADDDVLEGGQGDDTLNGGAGHNVFVFNKGDGHDSVTANWADGQTLRLGAGIQASDVALSYNETSSPTTQSLSVLFKSSPGDVVTSDGIYSSIEFADGTVWNQADVFGAMTKGSWLSDRISGMEQSNDVLDGHEGNDTLFGLSGDDSLIGGLGNDLLVGGLGQDTLDGGAGDDGIVTGTATGGGPDGDTSPDTVLFGRTDGNDLVYSGKGDVIQFKADIKPADVFVSWQVNPSGGLSTMNLAIKNELSSVSVADIGGPDVTVKFSDGTVWNQAYLASFQSNGFAKSSDYNQGGDGNDFVMASTYSIGYTSLYGGAGNDILHGSANDELLDGGTGADLMIGGAGNDQYYVDNSGDQVIEKANEGIDTVHASITWTLADNVENLTLESAGSAAVDGTGNKGDNVVTGSLGANHLNGGQGNDTLYGLAGNDTINGGAGNDFYFGGEGNDLLIDTDGGDDTYEFDTVSGTDQIVDSGSAQATDTIIFDAGINASDVVVTRYADTVAGYGPGQQTVFQVKGTNTVVKVFAPTANTTNGDWGIEKVHFADGTVWDKAAITAHVVVAPPNLNLVGTSGKDNLKGGAGNDTLTGQAGNDTLAGGLGNDLLNGGKGNDTYLFARGDGVDTIVDNDSTWFNSDVLQVSGATSRQLWLQHKGNDLVISVVGTSDQVVIQDWYVSSAHHVEKLVASDGKTLTDLRVNALVTAMAAFSPPALGQTSLPGNVDTSLSKILASSWK